MPGSAARCPVRAAPEGRVRVFQMSPAEASGTVSASASIPGSERRTAAPPSARSADFRLQAALPADAPADASR